MYPPGFANHVEVEGLSDKLEGAARPGYFRSVATALDRMFNLVHPKIRLPGFSATAQQAVIVKKLIRDLHLSVEVMGHADSAGRRRPGLFVTEPPPDAPRRDSPRRALSLVAALAEEMFNDGERNPSRIIKAMRKRSKESRLGAHRLHRRHGHGACRPARRHDGTEHAGLGGGPFRQDRLTDNTILCDSKYKSKDQAG